MGLFSWEHVCAQKMSCSYPVIFISERTRMLHSHVTNGNSMYIFWPDVDLIGTILKLSKKIMIHPLWTMNIQCRFKRFYGQLFRYLLMDQSVGQENILGPNFIEIFKQISSRCRNICLDNHCQFNGLPVFQCIALTRRQNLWQIWDSCPLNNTSLIS